MNRTAKRQQRRRITSRRIIIRQRATYRAAIADLPVADMCGQMRQRWNCLLHARRVRNINMTRHRPNPDRIALSIYCR